MEQFVKGDVVVIPFPFSDLSSIKKRPALVLADLPGDDILLCQITSQPHNEASVLTLTTAHFVSGSLPVSSFIRPTRIFTADKRIIIRKAGTISHELMNNVTGSIVSLLKK
ncbi:MAG: type II toxin-antitoxin system PemK/MazF family toxin [Prevotellaceae bacterium]|jgi:mRNA interferase MazF|nr:type II toxin-antitoxin system PemK/MazF family toxin [Prevotellaceae bacterium]